MFLLHILLFSNANTVLAGGRASKREGTIYQDVVQLPAFCIRFIILGTWIQLPSATGCWKNT